VTTGQHDTTSTAPHPTPTPTPLSTGLLLTYCTGSTTQENVMKWAPINYTLDVWLSNSDKSVLAEDVWLAEGESRTSLSQDTPG
jgi:hypothetical protein